MIDRRLERALAESRLGYPASLVVGPRQSGKTSLVRRVFSDLRYVNFESPIERAEVLEDPVGYLSEFTGGAVLDEIQNVPELLSHLQVRIDEDGAMGRWALTGSQQLTLRGGVQQSLAGRVAQFELLPFSIEELGGSPRAPRTLLQAVLFGGYPPRYDENRVFSEPSVWLDDYLETFARRDIRSILELQESRAFDLFLKKSAGLTGQQLNKSTLGQLCGVDGKTIDAWVEALEIGFLARVVRPYHRNFGKRLAKQPKLYFLDSGLACRLLGISTVQQLEQHPLLGALVETWMYSEVQKYLSNRRLLAEIHFWRTSDGHEVDFVIESGSRLVPVEAKASRTPSSKLAAGIAKLSELGGAEVARGAVLYGGEESRDRSGAPLIAPWHSIASALDEVL